MNTGEESITSVGEIIGQEISVSWSKVKNRMIDIQLERKDDRLIISLLGYEY